MSAGSSRHFRWEEIYIWLASHYHTIIVRKQNLNIIIQTNLKPKLIRSLCVFGCIVNDLPEQVILKIIIIKYFIKINNILHLWTTFLSHWCHLSKFWKRRLVLKGNERELWVAEERDALWDWVPLPRSNYSSITVRGLRIISHWIQVFN